MTIGLVSAGLALGTSLVMAAETAAPEHNEPRTWMSEVRDRVILTADVIAMGLVCCIETPHQGGYLDVGLLVEQVLKGPPAKGIYFVTQPAYADGPYFSNGERAMVFLRWHPKEEGSRVLQAFHYNEKHLLPTERAGIWGGLSLEYIEAYIDSLLAPRAPASLLAASDLVATGVVERVIGSGEPPTSPYGREPTYAGVRLDEIIKGSAMGDSITVVIPGFKGHVIDRAILEPGERVLLFLALRSDGHYDVAGGHDGKHRINDSTTTHVFQQLGELAEMSEADVKAPPN